MAKSKPLEKPTEYLTKEQVAAMLNVSTRTINRLTFKGLLTAIRPPLGRRVFYDKAQVEALKAEIITPEAET